MQITSDTNIVPIVFARNSNILIEAFAPKKKACVSLYNTEYTRKGDVSSSLDLDQANNFVILNCFADIEEAAKLILKVRPDLTDEFPAAVLRYNPAYTHQDVMYWHPVNKLGQFQPYTNSGWFDVPENGAFLHPKCETDHTRIFYSPVDAITAAADQTIKFIGDLRREAKAEEEKIQQQIEEKKALIDLINKSQEI